MSDRRLLASNGRAALEELRGQVEAAQFVPGAPLQIAVPIADLCDAPNGARDRQLRLGAAITQIEQHEGWSFVRNDADGYVGYVRSEALTAPSAPTHRVITRATHAYRAPKVQAPELCALPFDARLTISAAQNGFTQTPIGWVPSAHLAPIAPMQDPVSVAEALLGTPYLWGGNSSFGIDCSGLVQLGCAVCDIPCPGDADLQENAVGAPLPDNAVLQRGDLLFWRGHVAWVRDEHSLIHANGHSMSVAIEGISDAIERIARHEYGAVTSRRRINRPV